MRNTKLLIWGLGLFVVLAVVAVVFNNLARTPDPGGAPAAAPVVQSTPSVATRAPSTEGSGSPGTTEPTVLDPSAGATLSSAPTSSRLSPAPSTSTAVPGSKKPNVAEAQKAVPSPSAVDAPKLEMLPDNEPIAGTLPKSVERRPVLSGAVPKSGTGNGKLTKGFPQQALPIPAGAQIVDSSVAAHQRRVQLAVNYRTSLSVEKTVAFYEKQAAKLGWIPIRSTGTNGSHIITLGYGKDNVVATVNTTGTGSTTVSAFGTYQVGK